jgi:hypothetical protein
MTTPTRCARCSVLLVGGWIMSFMNDDIVCIDCYDDEKGCPNYGIAREAEMRAVKAGVRDFKGIGLAPEDREYIRATIAKRRDREGLADPKERVVVRDGAPAWVASAARDINAFLAATDRRRR